MLNVGITLNQAALFVIFHKFNFIIYVWMDDCIKLFCPTITNTLFLGLPPGLVTSAASLLAGLPPASSAAFAAAHMARMPLPLNHQDIAKKEEEYAKMISAPLGPSSEERHVSIFWNCSYKCFVLQKNTLNPTK